MATGRGRYPSRIDRCFSLDARRFLPAQWWLHGIVVRVLLGVWKWEDKVLRTRVCCRACVGGEGGGVRRCPARVNVYYSLTPTQCTQVCCFSPRSYRLRPNVPAPVGQTVNAGSHSAANPCGARCSLSQTGRASPLSSRSVPPTSPPPRPPTPSLSSASILCTRRRYGQGEKEMSTTADVCAAGATVFVYCLYQQRGGEQRSDRRTVAMINSSSGGDSGSDSPTPSCSPRPVARPPRHDGDKRGQCAHQPSQRAHFILPPPSVKNHTKIKALTRT